jgi:hypothetical protein
MKKLPDHFWDFMEDGDFKKFAEKEAQSWYCEKCAVEVYSLRCLYCGKTKRARS